MLSLISDTLLFKPILLTDEDPDDKEWVALLGNEDVLEIPPETALTLGCGFSGSSYVGGGKTGLLETLPVPLGPPPPTRLLPVLLPVRLTSCCCCFASACSACDQK